MLGLKRCPCCGLVRAVDAIAVELVRPGVRQEAVPDHVGLLGQRDPTRFFRRVGRVEQAQFDLGRVRGEEREVDADAGPGRAERIGIAGPDSHALAELQLLCHCQARVGSVSRGLRSRASSPTRSRTDR